MADMSGSNGNLGAMPKPAVEIRVCSSDALLEGAAGIRWPATFLRNAVTVFFVRHSGTVRGFLNMCSHVPVELDWNEGHFFDSSGLYLICSTHGALYDPENGFCVAGPCSGASLRQLVVEERDTPDGRAVFWRPDEMVHARSTTAQAEVRRPGS